ANTPASAKDESRVELVPEVPIDVARPVSASEPSLEVRAVTPDGVPVADLDVSLFPAKSDEPALAEFGWRAEKSATTDGAGRVRFDAIAAGEWAVAPTPAKRFEERGSLSDPTLAPGVLYVTLTPGDGLVSVDLV